MSVLRFVAFNVAENGWAGGRSFASQEALRPRLNAESGRQADR